MGTNPDDKITSFVGTRKETKQFLDSRMTTDESWRTYDYNGNRVYLI